MLSEMDVRDKTNNPPKYRDIAKRLQKIRKDRSLTVKQFAESLYKPLGVEPLPTQEFNYTPKQIHALEYGTMKIDEKLAEVVFRVFGVSGEWLLWNRGTPHTKTDTLTLPRLLDIENTLQNTVDRQKKIIGEEFMKELAKDGHPLTFKDENGNDVMRGATNARIRFDLYHAEERIKSLEKQVELLTTLLNNYIGQVEALKSTSITEQGVIDILDTEFAPDPPDIERDPEGNPL
jgi:transcriptional regulator with XRE-family HTH domain